LYVKESILCEDISPSKGWRC